MQICHYSYMRSAKSLCLYLFRFMGRGPGSRIPDPKTAMKDIGEKNLLSYLFFGVINFTKFNYFIFEMSKKKIWANFQRIIELFTQKIVFKLSKTWGSGIQDPEKPIPDP